MKIFRILSPGKPKQLALPGSSKKFYKGLKMSFSKFQKYCILPFLTYSNQIPNLLTFTFSCIRIFPTISIVTVCVSYLVVSDSATPWLPGSFVHGILQARILEWAAVSFSGAGIEPRSPALWTDSWPSEPRGRPSIFTTTAQNNAFFLRTLKAVHWIVLQCELFFHVNAFYTVWYSDSKSWSFSLLSLKSMTVHTAN